MLTCRDRPSELWPRTVNNSLAKVHAYADSKTAVGALTAATGQAGYPSRLTP